MKSIVSKMVAVLMVGALTGAVAFAKVHKQKVTFDNDIKVNGTLVKKGTYDLQRFMYYNMFKCYWNSKLSFDDNVHVNFDWYHPRYSHRHTPEQVQGWLKELDYELEGHNAERFAGRAWIFDHCHVHGWVRGLVCGYCNGALGLADAGRLTADDSTWAPLILAFRDNCPDCRDLAIGDNQ